MNDAYFKEKAACCMTEDKIERNLFDEFGVKRGLRERQKRNCLSRRLFFRKNNLPDDILHDTDAQGIGACVAGDA